MQASGLRVLDTATVIQGSSHVCVGCHRRLAHGQGQHAKNASMDILATVVQVCARVASVIRAALTESAQWVAQVQDCAHATTRCQQVTGGTARVLTAHRFTSVRNVKRSVQRQKTGCIVVVTESVCLANWEKVLVSAMQMGTGDTGVGNCALIVTRVSLGLDVSNPVLEFPSMTHCWNLAIPLASVSTAN